MGNDITWVTQPSLAPQEEAAYLRLLKKTQRHVVEPLNCTLNPDAFNFDQSIIYYLLVVVN